MNDKKKDGNGILKLIFVIFQSQQQKQFKLKNLLI